MKIYVGNLSFRATETDVRNAFAAHGEVSEVSIVMDRETGRSRGFAFVEMPQEEEARAAIAAVHGREISGRGVTANEARPPEEIGIGARLPGRPPTPPSMRIRTRRFVSVEQADSKDLKG